MAEKDDALVPLGERRPDAFERAYMPGEGTVLYRDKMVAGTKMNLVLVGIAGLVVAKAAVVGAWASAVFVLPLLAILWILFGVLRVSVSERAVTVKLGLFGPTIPVTAIERATAIDYKWTTFGGWGIRRGPGGWMYNLIGDGGRAVKIVWRDAAGREKITYVGTRTAEQLAAAINGVCTALPSAPEPKALEP